jgi:hypothetical protein
MLLKHARRTFLGLLALALPIHCDHPESLAAARWLLAEVLQLGGPAARQAYANASQFSFDDNLLDIKSIADAALAALAALASPSLHTATDRYRIALAASHALARYLSIPASNGGARPAIPDLGPLLAWWRPQGNYLSPWAVQAAVEAAARQWDPRVHGDAPAFPHEHGLASSSRQTNATSAFALR